MSKNLPTKYNELPKTYVVYKCINNNIYGNRVDSSSSRYNNVIILGIEDEANIASNVTKKMFHVLPR